MAATKKPKPAKPGKKPAGREVKVADLGTKKSRDVKGGHFMYEWQQ